VTQVDASRSGAVLRLYYGLGHLVRELLKFGVVGSVGVVVDVGLTNLMHLHFGLGPLTSKTIGALVAITVTFIGNRHWTFRHRGGGKMHEEYVLFLILSGVGLGITLAITAFSYYVLDLRSALAFNVAANVIGLGVATAFRFWSYRRWVFPAMVEEAVELAEDDAEAAEEAASHDVQR
jgi:putative flippase GtrA